MYQQVMAKRLSVHQPSSVLSTLIKVSLTKSFGLASSYERRGMQEKSSLAVFPRAVQVSSSGDISAIAESFGKL